MKFDVGVRDLVDSELAVKPSGIQHHMPQNTQVSQLGYTTPPSSRVGPPIPPSGVCVWSLNSESFFTRFYSSQHEDWHADVAITFY